MITSRTIALQPELNLKTEFKFVFKSITTKGTILSGTLFDTKYHYF